MDETVIRGVLAVCAIVGAVLGVINFYRLFLSDRERVTVNLLTGSTGEIGAIEVVNRSHFPITIAKVRRMMKDGRLQDISHDVGGRWSEL